MASLLPLQKLRWLYIHRLSSFSLPVYLFTLALIARLMPGPRTIDDAYITFRYARNILAGNGFVFNPGEHVLGTTTPLYTILLVIFGRLFGSEQAPFPLLAMVINAIADGVTCVLLCLLGRRLRLNFTAIGAGLVWAIAPYSVTFAIGGLETSIYVLLLTAIIYAHLRRKRLLVAFLASLSLLTRPDALILLLPLAIDRILSKTDNDQYHQTNIGISNEIPNRANLRKNRARISSTLVLEGLIFALPALVWGVFATIYFGTPIPHSILAKSLAYRLPEHAALVRLLQHYATPFLEHLTFGIPAIAVGLILYPFLFIAGALKALKREFHLWPWLIYPWLYFVAFAIANPLIFRWYLTPPLPAYIWSILAGLEVLLLQVLEHPKENSSPVRRLSPPAASLIFLLTIAAPFMLTLRDWSLHPDHGLNRPAPQMAWYQLELLYRQAADYLRPQITRRSSLPVLAAGDVGVLGYYSGAMILDTVGLNSSVSTKYYPLDASYYEINYAIPPDLILDTRPDYVVILEVYGRRGLLKDPRFRSTYHLLASIPTDIYGSHGMLIFERNP